MRLFQTAAISAIFFLLSCTTAHSTSDFPDTEAIDATPDATDLAWLNDASIVQLSTIATETAANGWSEPVSFQVAQGTTALQIQFTAPAGHVLQLAELSGPDGPVVPGDWLKVGDQPWLYLAGQERVRATPWQAAFLVPNAPQIAVPPGLWQLRAFTFDYDTATQLRQPVATALDVRIDLVRKPAFVTGTVDLNFCLTGARGITAETAPNHPRVQDALQVVAQAWNPVGVKVGAVRYFDVPAKTLSVTHDDGDDAELADLLRLAAGQPPGIPVFLFESVDLDTGSGLIPAAGYTAGLPGPLVVGGPRTGIALALKYDQPDILGVVLAHELGHFLGLYHVVEAHAQGDKATEDRLTDTAPTPDNLMYYAPDPARLQVTPQQAAVVLGGPWVRP